MKLLLVSDTGSVIDSTEDFTRAEWDVAQTSSVAAQTFLWDLNADAS